MKLNRKWILIMSLVLSVAMATSGTLAYLTDRESTANVLTLGNVDIKLHEEFDQGSTLIPGVEITKTPTIENSGKNDAWVWMTVAIPDALANNVDINGSESGWVDGDDVTDESIPGYTLKLLKYNPALAVGDTTTAAFKVLGLDTTIDIDPNGELYSVVNGTATKLGWNINTNGDPTVYVSAYAIQKDNFASVDEGINAYNEQWGTNGGEFAEPANAIGSVEDLLALAGKNVEGSYILTADIDLKGDELPAIGAAYGKTLIIDGNGHTISNATLVTGKHNGMTNVGMFYAYTNSTLKISDLTIKNPKGVGENEWTTIGAAAVVGYADGGSNVVLDNVDVVNATIKNEASNAALLVGYTVGKVTLTDCDVSGTAEGEDYQKTGALVGTANTADCVVTVTNCSNATTLPEYGRVINGATWNGNSDSAKLISTAAELMALAETTCSGVYNLGANIDLAGYEMKAIVVGRNASLTFNGNGYTISNLNIVSGNNDNTTGQASLFYTYPGSTLNVSNLTLKNVNVTADENDTGYAATVVGYCEGTANLNNVDVVNANVTGAKSSGVLVGHLAQGASAIATNCDLNGTVKLTDYESNGHYAGKYFGTIQGTAQLNNCTASVKIDTTNVKADNVGDIYGRIVSPGQLN